MSNQAIVFLELSYSSLLSCTPFSLEDGLPVASVAGIGVGDSFWIASNEKFKEWLEQESGKIIDTSVKVVVKDKQHIFQADSLLHPVVRLALLVVENHQ